MSIYFVAVSLTLWFFITVFNKLVLINLLPFISRKLKLWARRMRRDFFKLANCPLLWIWTRLLFTQLWNWYQKTWRYKLLLDWSTGLVTHYTITHTVYHKKCLELYSFLKTEIKLWSTYNPRSVMINCCTIWPKPGCSKGE